jgi:glycosyltransferase involved in cell wall biosynthesis
MKVCIVTTAFPRWKGDDRGIFILNAARSLVRKGLQVSVIAMHSPGAATKDVLDGVEVIRPRYLPENLEVLQKEGGGLPVIWERYPLARLAIIPFTIQHILTTARVARYHDVVHANWLLSGLIVWISSIFHRKPFVITVQGSDVFKINSVPWIIPLARMALKRSNYIITLSNSLAEKTLRIGLGEKKPVIIPNGVFLDEFKVGNSSREKKILFAGSLIPRKGVEFLISAFPAVLEQFPESTLVIVGEGAQETSLKEKTKSLGISNQVYFMGRIPPEEVAVLMRSASIFVLPSIEEGLGVVLLEALASGTPCIGSNVGGIPDIIHENNGILVPPKNPDAISRAITDLFSDQNRWEQLSARCRSDAEEFFSWDIVADRIIALYEKATNQST